MKDNREFFLDFDNINEGRKSGDYSLHDWFTKSKSSDETPGWVQLGGKYAGKPCAKQPGQTTKPKCGSSKMKRALSDEEEQKAFERKNRQDPHPNRRGKAKMVTTEEKDACYHKVKSRYKVWPSAYASGALVKCRETGAKNWGNKKKTFREFLEEVHLIEGQRHFSSRAELEKHHGGKLPDGTFIKNRGTKEAPKYGLASVQSRENEKERREKRIKQATGQLTPREKAKVERKRKLTRERGAELHHATEIETSGKEMKDMSPGDVLRYKKEQAKEKKYHGNDPRNLVVANKGPVSKFKPQQPGFHHGKFHAFERGNRKKLEDIGNVITPMRAFTTLVNKARRKTRRRKTRRGED